MANIRIDARRLSSDRANRRKSDADNAVLICSG